ncbi:MAG: hypothetical protein IKR25_10385 [Muribaculaceae bacterium]|nr:hypothetical protein [Muribaculaceae bacterium]
MTINELLTSSAEDLISKLIDSQARKVMPGQIVDVVNKHGKLAAGAGLVPVPGADLVMGTANTVKMFKSINTTLGIGSNDLDFKTITSTLLSQFAARFATTGVANSLKFIPGVGQVTGALMSSALQYVMALSAGYVYFNALSTLVDGNGNITLNKLGDAIKTTLADKEKIDAIIEAIKSSSSRLIDTVKDNVDSWSNGAKESISSAAVSVSKGASAVCGTVSEGINTAASSVADAAGTAAVSLKSGASAVMNEAGKRFSSLGKSVNSLWTKKKNKIVK